MNDGSFIVFTLIWAFAWWSHWTLSREIEELEEEVEELKKKGPQCQD